MSKKEIEDVLTRINEKLLDINNLYEKLENSYSINKAFIDENSDDSLKKLVNDELAIIKSQSNDVSKMLNQLQESFEFLTSLQNNGKNRIQYIYDLLSDKVLEDIKEKSESFYKSYNEVFNGENGDLAEDFITKYEKINNLYKKLYENNNDKQSVSEELEEKIDNFFETYSILIKNDDDNSIYNEFIKKNDDFNNKKLN